MIQRAAQFSEQLEIAVTIRRMCQVSSPILRSEIHRQLELERYNRLVVQRYETAELIRLNCQQCVNSHEQISCLYVKTQCSFKHS